MASRVEEAAEVRGRASPVALVWGWARLVLTAAALLFLLVSNLREALPAMGLPSSVPLAVRQLIADAGLSYREKIGQKWGLDFYDYMMFVKQNTPPDAFLMTPPWFEAIGNTNVMQYFLYPRKLEPLYDPKRHTHILVVMPEACKDPVSCGWPRDFWPVRSFVHFPQQRWVRVGNLEVRSGGRLLLAQEFLPEKEGGKPRLREKGSDEEPRAGSSELSGTFGEEGELISLTLTRGSYSYWGLPTDFSLSSGLEISARVKVGDVARAALVASVAYGEGRFAVFASEPNRLAKEWEVLALADLRQRAIRYGAERGWPTEALKLDWVGVDAAVPRAMPYMEGWGVIELERGQVPPDDASVPFWNAARHIAWGNYYAGLNQNERALEEFNKALALETDNAQARGWAEYLKGRL